MMFVRLWGFLGEAVENIWDNDENPSKSLIFLLDSQLKSEEGETAMFYLTEGTIRVGRTHKSF